MTKEEQIKFHLTAIRDASAGSRLHAAAIKELLEPEPETLAASVLRLTDTCNALEMENHELRQDLKTGQADAKKQISTLQVTVAKTKALLPYDCATVEELAKLRAEIEYQNKLLGKANEKLASREACLRRVRTDLDHLMKWAWM